MVEGYKTIGSPYTSLQETWETLKNIKTSLDAIPDERRQKIEAAAQRRFCRSIADIEKEFQEYVLSPSVCHFESELTSWQVCGIRTVH